MEGLLFLLLLSWLFKAAKKKKGNSKNTIHKQLRDGLKKAAQAMEQTQRTVIDPPPAAEGAVSREPGEGQSYMQVTWDSHESEYMGSLAADTSEGEDVCDPSLGHVRTEIREEKSVYEGEIGSKSAFDLSPGGIYQGFVMSEILKRPAGTRGIRR